MNFFSWNLLRHTLYTPKVEDPSNKATLKLMPEPNNNNQDEPDYQEEQPREEPQVDRKPREEEDEESNESSEEEIAIIPWRAQLRKTNSKLNLLDWWRVLFCLWFNYCYYI